LGFQMAGTLLGCLLAAVLGTWLERRSRRAAQHVNLDTGAPS